VSCLSADLILIDLQRCAILGDVVDIAHPRFRGKAKSLLTGVTSKTIGHPQGG
jgi:hypothetical protein